MKILTIEDQRRGIRLVGKALAKQSRRARPVINMFDWPRLRVLAELLCAG